jgi:hypothetical protein
MVTAAGGTCLFVVYFTVLSEWLRLSVLPPCMMYKTKEFCTEWVEGGTTGSAYNQNSSDWFEDFFFFLLPLLYFL